MEKRSKIEQRTHYLITINMETQPNVYRSITQLCEDFDYPISAYKRGILRVVKDGNVLTITKANLVPMRNRGRNLT